MILKKPFLYLIILLLSLSTGCGDNKKQANKPAPIDVPDISMDLQMNRFEQEIFEHPTAFDSTDIIKFRQKYGRFFDLYCTRLAGFIPESRDKLRDSYIAYNLNQYVNDQYIRMVYNDCKKEYSNSALLKTELSEIFKRYSILFPGKPIPGIVTYVSPFTSNVMAMDSLLGLGLHFYLGADYKYYPSLQLPRFMTRKFSKEYILPDMMKGWIDSEYTNDKVHRSFLNQMINQGKILYTLDLLLPEIEDSIKIGYTSEQFNWSLQNEQKIWAFIIEQQLLYNSNPKEYMRFINDGNGTSGFPKEAPAQLGVFIGWQIVRSFMHAHPGTKLNDLFAIEDAQLILAQSGYKPQKNS
jgi:hypothetical protein